jgi:tetratricopeptide (TPR) repeat protein
MGAVTYPDSKVIQFIENNLVPVQVLSDQKPLSVDFNVKWTPTLITLDTDGKEHHRTVGFLPPEELIASLLLGMGKTSFDKGEFEAAISSLEKLVSDFPKSDSAPEGIFFLGVARYKNTEDPKALRAAYDKLSAEYPENEWTKRAYPYRLID